MKKSNNKIKINDNTGKKILIALGVVLLIAILLIVFFNIIIKHQVSKSVVTTVNDEDSLLDDKEIEWFSDEENNKIDISDIISKNLGEAEKEEIETQIVELEYETEYQNNNKLPKGMVKVLQQGQDGKQELIIRKNIKEKK